MKQLVLIVLLVLAGGATGVGGCATSGVPAGMIAVHVESNIPDATVWIDDKLAGKVSDWPGSGVRLRAGFHRIEVRHPGHYSFFQEVETKSGDEVRVHAQLREVLE